jgi:hypothetical protein
VSAISAPSEDKDEAPSRESSKWVRGRKKILSRHLRNSGRATMWERVVCACDIIPKNLSAVVS